MAVEEFSVRRCQQRVVPIEIHPRRLLSQALEFALLVCALVFVTGCETGSFEGEPRRVSVTEATRTAGSVDFTLALPPDNDLDVLILVLSCPEFRQEHTVDLTLPYPVASFGGISPGTCTVVAETTTHEGQECRGSTRFDIEPGEITQVELKVRCGVSEDLDDGAAEIIFELEGGCAERRIARVSTEMLTLEPGDSTDVQVEVSGAGTGTEIDFTLVGADTGLFALEPLRACSASASACRRLSCRRAADDEDFVANTRLDVTITDGDCHDTESVFVQCIQHAKKLTCPSGKMASGNVCVDVPVEPEPGCEPSCEEPTPPMMRTPRCGDGVVDTGEQCDDGNRVPRDGCGLDCRIEVPACGDGVLDPDEECDGDAGLSWPNVQVCTGACEIQPVCGNGVLEGDEECDDGDQVDDAICLHDCEFPPPRCGDGRLDSGEQCDGMSGLADPFTQLCNASCAVVSVCGNGYLEAPELCDDGNLIPNDGCGDDCRPTAVPGDDTDAGVDPGPVCGDGKLDSGEACDGVAGLFDASLQQCGADCQVVPRCGNGVVEGAEECDDGGAQTGRCRRNCTLRSR